MNRLSKIRLFLILATVVLLALPGPVYAQNPVGDTSPVIFGHDYVLERGEVIKDLVVFGGNAILEQGSRITGDVAVFGGNIIASGEVGGSLTSFGGNIIVNDSALVGKDVNSMGGSLQISPKAIIHGAQLTGLNEFPLRIPNMIATPALWDDLGRGTGYLSAVITALLLALIAVVVTLFLPTPTERVARTITTQPIISGALGLLTLVVSPALFLVLAITLILIPLSLLGMLIFFIAMIFGWVAIGLALGNRLAALLTDHWATPLSAGIGSLLLSLAAGLLFAISAQWFWVLCCFAIPIVGVVSMVGLGAVVASKFGAQVYNPKAPIATSPGFAAPPPEITPLAPPGDPQPPQPPGSPQS